MPIMNQFTRILMLLLIIQNMLKTMSTIASKNNHMILTIMITEDIQFTNQSTQLLLSIQ